MGSPPAERIAAVDPAAVHTRKPLERTWNHNGPRESRDALFSAPSPDAALPSLPSSFSSFLGTCTL
jgi:hypothetical protein